MRLPTILPVLLATLLPLTNSAPTTLQSSNKFTLTSFTSYLASHSTPSNQEGRSWASFNLHIDSATISCIAIAPPLTSLVSKFYPCSLDALEPDMHFSFMIQEGFGMIEIVKVYKYKGDWYTGYADQGTYWKEGDGGNVTQYTYGKGYDRPTSWEFEITRMIS